jgi:hypothetical protein
MLPQSLQELALENNALSGTVRRSIMSGSLDFVAENSGLTVIP